MKRTVFILSACNGLAITSNVAILTISAIVSHHLVIHKSLATLPIALQQIAAMIFTAPASMLMKHFGRKKGFIVGVAFGFLGGILGFYGIVKHSFILLCVGSFFIGSANAFSFYYRFAVADIVTSINRSKAISFVMAGGVVAAFLGTNIANYTRGWITTALYAGGFLSVSILFFVTLLLLLAVQIPKPTELESHHSGRPLKKIANQPSFILSVFAGTIGYGLMSFLMCATPLSMQHHAHQFNDISFVIQWHVLGMFAPSFFTGYLIKKFGIIRILFAGAALNLLCIMINLSGQSVAHYWAALFILGVGWNFLFIGGTTLLTETYTVAEKAKAQALNDFLIFTVASFTAFMAGIFHHRFGWKAINLGCVPWIIVILIALAWYTKYKNQINCST